MVVLDILTSITGKYRHLPIILVFAKSLKVLYMFVSVSSFLLKTVQFFLFFLLEEELLNILVYKTSLSVNHRSCYDFLKKYHFLGKYRSTTAKKCGKERVKFPESTLTNNYIAASLTNLIDFQSLSLRSMKCNSINTLRGIYCSTCIKMYMLYSF